MHGAIWILLAFVIGVLFGRALRPGSTTSAGANSAPGKAFATAASPAAVAAGDPNGAYQITLVDRGSNLISTVKAVREVTRLGLKDAKDLAEAAPTPLIRVASADHAEAILRLFQGIATVRVDGPEGSKQPVNYGYAPVTKIGNV